MNNLVIIGAGGLAKEIAFLVEDINRVNSIYNILGYCDIDEKKIGNFNGKYKISFIDKELVKTKEKISVAIGIGNPKIIFNIIDNLKQNEMISFPNLVHPNFVGDIGRITMGEGNIITSSNIFTTDIKIGSFNIFNLNCTLGHDAVIGNYNLFNPSVNLSGSILIGNCNLIGTGAQLLEKITIGDNIVIGAGSVVTKRIDEEGIYVGIPARRLK